MIFASALCASGMWLYLQRVVIPHQVREAAIHGRPRGNLSDLYPRWLGSRELLLRGRDPYSIEVTREIQAGYYGRPLDPARPDDPRDEQRFAYPVYVAFLLAPTVRLPFETIRPFFFGILMLLTICSVPLWLRVIRWAPPWWVQISLSLFTLGSPAVMQGLKLQQLSLLVAAMILAAVLLLRSGHLSAAGTLLALSTIKPQVVWLLLVWLTVWTASDWKRRYRLLVSFLVTMTILLVSSEIYLPHWIQRFWEAVEEYRKYTGASSVLSTMISPVVGVSVAILSLAMTALICWKERKRLAGSEAFARVLCVVLAVTVLVAPTAAVYNEIFLLPSILLLARDWRHIARRSASGTFLIGSIATLAAWPWITSIVIAGLSFVTGPEVAQRFWTVPFWTVWLNPMAVAAPMLIVAYRGTASPTPERATA
ncbi:MAG: hypothetical protein DMG80_08595 [Acidobacteria bacterium]|nr:MAG: hypothetical protein DMG80_08595 [Acidobacteriota bacterium]